MRCQALFVCMQCGHNGLCVLVIHLNSRIHQQEMQILKMHNHSQFYEKLGSKQFSELKFTLTDKICLCESKKLHHFFQIPKILFVELSSLFLQDLEAIGIKKPGYRNRLMREIKILHNHNLPLNKFKTSWMVSRLYTVKSRCNFLNVFQFQPACVACMYVCLFVCQVAGKSCHISPKKQMKSNQYYQFLPLQYTTATLSACA